MMDIVSGVNGKMKKPIDFSTYQRLQKMSFNEFNRWITKLYKTAYIDGANACEIDDSELSKILTSVKGVGEKRAKEIIQKLKET